MQVDKKAFPYVDGNKPHHCSNWLIERYNNGVNGGAACTYQMGKRYETGGQRMEELRNLTLDDYLFHISNRDKQRKTLETVRTCFTFKNTYFVMETHVNVPGQPTIMRTQSCVKNVELPPFI